MTCRLTAGGHVFPGEADSMTAAGIGRNDDKLRNAGTLLAHHRSPHFAGPGWAQPARWAGTGPRRRHN